MLTLIFLILVLLQYVRNPSPKQYVAVIDHVAYLYHPMLTDTKYNKGVHPLSDGITYNTQFVYNKDVDDKWVRADMNF